MSDEEDGISRMAAILAGIDRADRSPEARELARKFLWGPVRDTLRAWIDSGKMDDWAEKSKDVRFPWKGFGPDHPFTIGRTTPPPDDSETGQP